MCVGIFFSKLTSKKTGAGEFKTHNHQTCLLGSSGMVAHLVDLASLFLPHNTRTFTRCTSKIKSELGGISFLGGICQNPTWPFKICQDALGAMPLEMEPGFQKKLLRILQNSGILPQFLQISVPQNRSILSKPHGRRWKIHGEAPIAPRPIGQSGRHRHHSFFALGEFHQSHVPASYDLTSVANQCFAIAGM